MCGPCSSAERLPGQLSRSWATWTKPRKCGPQDPRIIDCRVARSILSQLPQVSILRLEACKGRMLGMANELAAVSESIDLLPREVLDRAEAFLREQGYSVVHRMFTSLTTERTLPDSAGGQEKWTITILVLPEREGGLRLKVLG